MTPTEKPTWTKVSDIPRVVLFPPYLRKTITTSIVVGSVLFVINHIDEVLAGSVSAAVYKKGLLTFIVPFVVTNWGILTASRRK